MVERWIEVVEKERGEGEGVEMMKCWDNKRLCSKEYEAGIITEELKLEIITEELFIDNSGKISSLKLHCVVVVVVLLTLALVIIRAEIRHSEGRSCKQFRGASIRMTASMSPGCWLGDD